MGAGGGREVVAVVMVFGVEGRRCTIGASPAELGEANGRLVIVQGRVEDHDEPQPSKIRLRM